MFTQQVTAGFFEAHSLWIPAFLAIDKLHWLPIHSLMLMFDQLHCSVGLFAQYCLPTVDQVWYCEIHSVLTPEPVYVRQCLTFSFVGNFWLYLQILFKYGPDIKYKHFPFCDLQFNFFFIKKQIYIGAQHCHKTNLKLLIVDTSTQYKYYGILRDTCSHRR